MVETVYVIYEIYENDDFEIVKVIEDENKADVYIYENPNCFKKEMIVE
jgi:hypothetical protein